MPTFGHHQATDLDHGAELWRTDGTGAGTVLVKDIYPGEKSGAPTFFTPFGDYLYFQVPAAMVGGGGRPGVERT